MSELTLDASAYGPDQFPARGGDWVGCGEPLIRIAQIKRVWWDRGEILADLYLYAFHGERIGRESPNEPFTILGKTYRGPRTYEPACPLADWYRIEKPDFPIELSWRENGNGSRSGGYFVEPRPWGKYVRRKKQTIEPPAALKIEKPNFDPELERRARLLAAELLRDVAREGGDLKAAAERLEKEAEKF
jgi:hypothetical protein